MTIRRINRLNRYLNANKLPPCECKGWKVGYCQYGDEHTRTKNSKGKTINTECCSPQLIEEGGLYADIQI